MPTVLGLGIIIFGIGAGVFLVLREQTFISQASPNLLAQNINVTNVSDSSATISWQTSAPTTSFLTFGQQNPEQKTVLDDQDPTTPKPHSIHYVTLKNLLPKTTYQYRIVSGQVSSTVDKFTTASPTSQTGLQPIIGTVSDGTKAVDEAVVYLSIADAATLSALVKNSGNFLIPLSQIKKTDGGSSFTLTEDTILKLTAISPNGESNVLFKIHNLSEGSLPPISVGENLDLTTLTPSPLPSGGNLVEYDLNGDGKINAADNAIILDVISKKTTNQNADLNSDGKVNQKDLDLMAKQINQ